MATANNLHKYEKVSMVAACVGVGLHQMPHLAVTASGPELHRALVTINNRVTHCCAAFIVHVRAPRTHDCFDWAKHVPHASYAACKDATINQRLLPDRQCAGEQVTLGKII